MSVVTRVIVEAEAVSSREALRLMREEDLRAAMRAALHGNGDYDNGYDDESTWH